MSDGDELDPTLPPDDVRVGPLKTAKQVRTELARLYKSARIAAGTRPKAGDAAKLGYLLNCLNKAIESDDFDARLRTLEEAVKQREV